MNCDSESIALCALNMILGYRPRLALELIEAAGGAAALFGETPPPRVAADPELRARLTRRSLERAAEALEKLHREGFRFLPCTSGDYPALLAECGDRPLGLYLNGSTPPGEIFGQRPAVAFVGTRDIGPYGRLWCRKLVEALAEAPVKPCIVSGLAIGADGIAHRTALDCGLPTIGVMATGIDRIYPRQHERLAAEIVSRPGCALVTDYPAGTAPVALNFLRRNRIIAGLSAAVVVVESKTRGGSLMTARLANEYGRDVYAVPGRLDDLRSAGCNSLIREHMAEIVTTPEDLAARLGLGAPVRGAGGSWKSAPEGLHGALGQRYGAQAAALAAAVQAKPGIGPERLAAQLGLPYSRVLELVGLLEADGFVETDLLRRCTLSPSAGTQKLF